MKRPIALYFKAVCFLVNLLGSSRIDLSWDGMDNAPSYVVEMSTEGPSGGWQQARISAKSSCTIKELASGTKCWFHVAAISTAGQGPWSQPVQKMAPRTADRPPALSVTGIKQARERILPAAPSFLTAPLVQMPPAASSYQ